MWGKPIYALEAVRKHNTLLDAWLGQKLDAYVTVCPVGDKTAASAIDQIIFIGKIVRIVFYILDAMAFEELAGGFCDKQIP